MTTKSRKVGVYIFLALLIIGFSVPGLYYTQEEPIAQASQRLCQYDSDCYLLCDDTPVQVLCLQNLCQQNSCEQFSYYQYKTEPLTFTLTIVMDGSSLPLEAASQDSFVQFQGDQVHVFTRGLTIPFIVERAGMRLTEQCLYTKGNTYCQDDGHTLQLYLNGNNTLSLQDYIPYPDDVIAIVYS